MSMSMSVSTSTIDGMASSTSMPGMASESSSTMMSMSAMMMVFFTSTSTPLFSSDWIPANTGQYVGTCIFLITLSTLFRGLLAIRTNFRTIMAAHRRRNETAILNTDEGETKCARRRPWTLNEALVRACVDTILTGVSYLLMLAVMTMNLGYFLSVLAGAFLGSLAFGGFAGPAGH